MTKKKISTSFRLLFFGESRLIFKGHFQLPSIVGTILDVGEFEVAAIRNGMLGFKALEIFHLGKDVLLLRYAIMG